MALDYRIEIPPGGFVTLGGEIRRLAERLALEVSDKAATKALRNIRVDMAGANLGRLGNAITMTSDKRKGGRLYRQGGTARASGVIYIRSKSPRTVGAIISYTEGSNILPVKGRWLWFPTDNAQRVIGSKDQRRRLTPALWRQRGLDEKIGPLIRLRSVNGNPILAVKNVAVGQVAGGKTRARKRLKNGGAPKGTRQAELVVMFIGIPRTSRAARVNVRGRAFEAAKQAAAGLKGV
jgi:hypothetical protein